MVETSADAVQKAHKVDLPVYLMSIEDAVEKLGTQP